jgi:predicted transcriptional regulator
MTRRRPYVYNLVEVGWILRLSGEQEQPELEHAELEHAELEHDRVEHGNAGQEGPGPRRAAGALEAEVLAVLQAADAPLAPGEVRERLAGRLAYTTVVTILSRLHAKGVLTRARAGRAFTYAPVADEAGLAARRMQGVLEGEDDREAVLARFVSGLTQADEQLLRRMLDEHPDQNG